MSKKFAKKQDKTLKNQVIFGIHSVKAACGCTVLKGWPKEPIPPGGTGEIPIVLTTKNKGYNKKYISVLSNTKAGIQKLFLEGYVVGL